MSSFKWALTEHIDVPIPDWQFMTVSFGGVKLLCKLEGSKLEGDTSSIGVNLTATKLEGASGSKLEGSKLEGASGSKLEGDSGTGSKLDRN